MEQFYPQNLYPISPVNVPAELTAPTKRYKRHAWLASLGLLVFIIVYFSLAAWFGMTAYHLLSGMANADDGKVIGNLFFGVVAAFLAVFMLKALFFVKHGHVSKDIEITEKQQPHLFAFINKLASEVGAPRAHRVFLSSSVNASVFYDLSIANLIFPSRKNLEIGLPLVNVLNLGEFKAVLAHEFGHFAQRSMAVGRWVYIANQIASHIVSKRDAMDTFLQKLSNFDFRIAWVGWILRVIVWAIRSLVDILFRVVVLAARALSREMEFQADLVSVSVAGSDALINALHKLPSADDAWSRTLSFAANELQNKRAVGDLFAVQHRIVEKMRGILNDQEYCASPGAGTPDRRLFKAALAAPPQMWSTHPASTDREHNAKRIFISAGIDERSAWELFKDSQSLRETASLQLLNQTDIKPVGIDETLEACDQYYSKTYLDSKYRGAYLGRSIVRRLEKPSDIYGTPPQNLIAELDSLYPESLSQEIELLRELESEKSMLEALRAGYLTAPGDVIEHRGEQISRKHLPDVIAKEKEEIDAVSLRIWNHDSRCRTAHLAAANQLGADWGDYLKGLFALHHYATHAEANLRDAHTLLLNTYNVAIADGKISKNEFLKIKQHGILLRDVIEQIHKEIPEVVPDRTVLGRMKKESWREAIEELTLGYPNDENLGKWMNVIDGWVNSFSNSLGSLQMCALEQLLAAEHQVAQFVRQQVKPREAPPASKVPQKYELLLPGDERKKQSKLDWWDQFQTASGWLPGIARSAAAALIVGSFIWFGASVGGSTVYVYNGLGTSVKTQIGDQSLTLAPFSHQSIDVGNVKQLHVKTTTSKGELIEEFDTNLTGSSANDVYNIASIGVMVSWTAHYVSAGSVQQQNSSSNEQVNSQSRWFATHADAILVEPPATVSTKGGYASRTVLSAYEKEGPETVAGFLRNNKTELQRIILQHAKWDETTSPYSLQWFAAASSQPEFKAILQQRLIDTPKDIVVLRTEQDISEGEDYKEVCARHTQMAAQFPDSADLQYIATRCIADRSLKENTFIEIQKRWPNNPWISLGAGYAYAGYMKWDDAQKLFDFAQKKLPSMRTRLIEEMVRINRVSGSKQKNSFADLKKMSERLYVLSLLDTNESTKYEGLRAYQFLAQGDLVKAMTNARLNDEEKFRVLRLIGASSGANATEIAEALSLTKDQGIDEATYFISLALAVKHEKPVDAILPLAYTFYASETPVLLNAFELLRRHAPQDSVEAALQTIDPAQRGFFYAAAAVLWGDNCPLQWRRMANQLLFATERPFIRI